MGFYSELQMEIDDYEAWYAVKASSRVVELCTKKVHAQRKKEILHGRLSGSNQGVC